jgi:putative transposase
MRNLVTCTSVAPNTLERNFCAAEWNAVWADDIAYLRVGSIWAYLATVIDLHSRRIVGWTTANSIHAVGALNMAIAARKPPPGIHRPESCSITTAGASKPVMITPLHSLLQAHS